MLSLNDEFDSFFFFLAHLAGKIFFDSILPIKPGNEYGIF